MRVIARHVEHELGIRQQSNLIIHHRNSTIIDLQSLGLKMSIIQFYIKEELIQIGCGRFVVLGLGLVPWTIKSIIYLSK